MTEAIGMALVHLLWQGALVAAILAIVLHLIPRSASNLRYALSCAALLLVVGAGIATAWMSYEPATALQGVTATANVSDGASATAEKTAGEDTRAPLLSDFNLTTEPWADVVRRNSQTVVLIWMLGVIILAARLAVSWRRAHAITQRMATPAPAGWQIVVDSLSQSIGLRRAVKVLSSAAVEVPAVIGWLRPAILLPVSALSGLTPAQLEMILAHELAHIRRHDFLVNMIQSVIETLLFYHPAVWWISRQVRIERENCCDDMAVMICGNAVQYARALTLLEQLREGSPALAVAATGGSLFDRVRRLVGSHDRNRVVNGWTAAAAAIALTAVIALSSFPALAERAEPTPQPAASEIEVAASPLRPLPPVEASDELPGVEPLEPIDQLDFEEPDLDEVVIDIDEDMIEDALEAAMEHAEPQFEAAMEAMEPVMAMAVADADFGDFGDFDDAGDADDQSDTGNQPIGSGKLTIDQLIAMKIHGVTPQYIDEMKKLGLLVTLNDIVAMKIHDVTPKYVADIRAAGVTLNRSSDILALKIHGVTPEFIQQLRAAGYDRLSARDLARLASSGVNSDFIREMSKYRTKD